MTAYVYMMANHYRGVIYIGATVDFWKRGQEHRTKMMDGFTKKYNVTRLVWIEEHDTAENAFAMERKLKNLSRQKKIEIIERKNPEWNDLYNYLTEGDPVLTRCVPQD
jgi:putative endonuclease